MGLMPGMKEWQGAYSRPSGFEGLYVSFLFGSCWVYGGLRGIGVHPGFWSFLGLQRLFEAQTPKVVSKFPGEKFPIIGICTAQLFHSVGCLT